MLKLLNTWIEKKYPSFEKLFSEEDGASQKITLNRVLFTILSYAVVSVILLVVINIILISFTDRGGVFGDFLGGVLNPILAFFTFFGLIATIVIQRQELKLSRVEYEKTADALSTQAIETTFFNILDLHHKIVDNIKLDLDDISGASPAQKALTEVSLSFAKIKRKTLFQGRGAFEKILEFISHDSQSPQEVVERYKQLQNRNNHIFGHYFRNLYQALKVIDSYDESKLTREQKNKYSSILRAQLSTKELGLLFINCLDGISDKGQFKNLLIEYAMLEHLPIRKVDKGYSLADTKYAVADDAMFLQYKSKKNIGISLTKCYGGAFGMNAGVPYNLK